MIISAIHACRLVFRIIQDEVELFHVEHLANIYLSYRNILGRNVI